MLAVRRLYLPATALITALVLGIAVPTAHADNATTSESTTVTVTTSVPSPTPTASPAQQNSSTGGM